MRALLLFCFLALPACVQATSARGVPASEAVVTEVISTTVGPSGPLQQVWVEILTPPNTGVRERLIWGGPGQPISYNALLQPGDHVILTRLPSEAATEPHEHEIVGIVRSPILAWVLVVVTVALFAFARWKGLAALAGLALSAGAFAIVVIPLVLRGVDPLVAALPAAAVVLAATTYLVHGLNRKSTVALGGAIGGLAVVAASGALVLWLGRIAGTSGPGADIALLPSLRGAIDLPHLALAGMILGGIGALVDMTIGQSSATFELAAVDPSLRGAGLYRRALNVGTDHIGALVNTLGFAYFAGALPLLVLLAARGDALAIAANDEGIVSALLATAVACLGLIVAVPLTTGIAVWTLSRRP